MKKIKKTKDQGVIVEDMEPEVKIDFSEKEEVEEKVEEEITEKEAERNEGAKAISLPTDEEARKKAVKLKETYVGAFVPQMDDILSDPVFQKHLKKRLSSKNSIVELSMIVSNLYILQACRDILKLLKENKKKGK